MKRIIIWIFYTSLAAGACCLFIFANQRQDDLVCPEFRIEVDYGNAPVLITQSNIRQEITREKIKVRENTIGKIEVEKIRKILGSNPYLKQATVNVGVNGIVKASVTQRKPMVRIVDLRGKQCYMDDEGGLMPLSPEYPARVTIASGNIKPVGSIRKPDRKKNEPPLFKKLPEDLLKVYLTAKALSKDTFCNALAEQIYINGAGKVELLPKIGQQNIILGDTSRLEEKLRNLRVFYSGGMKNEGWNTYKTINLEFRNQVVCIKNN